MANDLQKSFYTHNREKLRTEIRKDPDYQQLTVIAGHSMVQASADNTLPFVQDSTFFYLTGIEEPGMFLIIDGDTEYLAVPDADDVREAFDGSVNTRFLQLTSGISEIISHTQAWELLGSKLKTINKVAVMQPIDAYIDRHDMFANPSRARLTQKLAELNEKIEFIDLRPMMARMRMIKSDYEVRMIETAINRTAELFEIIEEIRSTATNERELHAAITAKRINLGTVDAYEPIIAGGANAVTLHYIQNNSPLKKDELLLLDIGLKFNGYSADITRTVACEPTKRQKQVYDAVLDVQQYALTLLKPGTDFREYETSVRDYMGTKLQELGLIEDITSENVRKYYPHSTSHFLGIDVHDVGDYGEPLKAGVVLTVEPGIYIAEEGIGIRIEDDVLITSEGYRILSNNLPKSIESLTIKE